HPAPPDKERLSPSCAWPAAMHQNQSQTGFWDGEPCPRNPFGSFYAWGGVREGHLLIPTRLSSEVPHLSLLLPRTKKGRAGRDTPALPQETEARKREAEMSRAATWD